MCEGVWWELFSDLTDLTDWHFLIFTFESKKTYCYLNRSQNISKKWAFKTSIVINFILLKVNKVKKIRTNTLEKPRTGSFLSWPFYFSYSFMCECALSRWISLHSAGCVTSCSLRLSWRGQASSDKEPSAVSMTTYSPTAITATVIDSPQRVTEWVERG